MAKKNHSRLYNTSMNVIISFGDRFLNIILAFVLRTVFIYKLGMSYTGISSLFTSILSMLSLSELGFGTAVATALYVPLHENDRPRIQKLMHFYKTAYRYVAAFVFAAGMAVTPFLHYIVKDVPDIRENIRIIFSLYIIKTAASYLMIYKSTLLRADQKIYKMKLWEMECIIIRYIVEIIGLLVFQKYMFYLVIEILAVITQNYIINKRTEREYVWAFEKPKETLEKSEVKKLLLDVKGISMYKISASVAGSIDDILISSVIGTISVGYLSNYTMVRKHVQSFLMQIFSSVLPSVGSVTAEKNIERQNALFNRLFYISFVIVNFCSVSLFVLLNPFIRLWLGDKYLLGIEIPFVIATDFFLYILLQAIATFRTANGLFVKGQYRPLATAIVNVILSIAFIHRFGIAGTIAATILARLTTQWYDPYLLYKYIFKKKFSLFYLKYWCYIGLYLLCCISTYKAAALCNTGNRFVSFILMCAICVIVPNLLVFIFTFRTGEYKYVIKLLKDVTDKLRRFKIKSHDNTQLK